MKIDIMNDHPEEINNRDYPRISEKNWETLSVSAAVFTFVSFVAAAIWLLEGGIEEGDLWKIQIFTPFGVALFAGVTYCTANWRGKINTRQADLAARQLRLSEQEGKAKLLQEGAKLLGEVGKPSHISAGISTLAILIMGDDDGFAVQAMNLIADLIQREMGNNHNHIHQVEAFLALKRGADIGRKSDREVRFDANNSDTRWEVLYGVKNALYVGGYFLGLGGEVDLVSENVYFSNVRFEVCNNMIFSHKFSNCKLKECDISVVQNFWSSDDPKMYHEFIDCDFSDAIFDDSDHLFNRYDVLRLIRGRDNYFVDGQPPRLSSGRVVNWLDHFSAQPHSRMSILF